MHLLTVEAMSMLPIRRSELVPFLHSSPIKLSKMRDLRSDGITFERTNILLLQHLQRMAPTKSLADFTIHGLQRVYIDYSDSQAIERSELFLKYLISTTKSKDSTWEVQIMQGYSWANWHLLSTFIEGLPTILTFKWAASFPIPTIILKALELNHPTCRLFYELDSHTADTTQRAVVDGDDEWRHQDTELDDSYLQNDSRAREIESIVNSTTLYSIRADFSILGNPGSELVLLHQMLTTCPNVRELDLHLNDQRCRGCYINQKQPRAFNFSKNSKTLPALEVLSLKGYSFESDTSGEELMAWERQPDTLRWPLNMVPTSVIQFIGYPWLQYMGGLVKGISKRRSISWDEVEEETNLDSWIRLMDWSHLHTLKLHQPSTQLRKLERDFLPNLKHVAFSGYRCLVQPVLSFLSNTSALESLSVHDVGYFSPEPIVDIILDNHCPTLTNLRLDRTFLNSTHLSRLLHRCPRLHTLDINMDRQEHWDYEFLDALAAFQELRSLTIRFDLRRITEDEEDAYLGYSWSEAFEYNQDALVDRSDETILLALNAYLAKRKRGTKFEKFRTMIGGLDVPLAAK